MPDLVPLPIPDLVLSVAEGVYAGVSSTTGVGCAGYCLALLAASRAAGSTSFFKVSLKSAANS